MIPDAKGPLACAITIVCCVLGAQQRTVAEIPMDSSTLGSVWSTTDTGLIGFEASQSIEDPQPLVPRSTKSNHTSRSCNTCRGAGIDYMLIYRGGDGYFNVPGESRIGYTHGLDVAIGLIGNVGFLGSINANHLPGNTVANGSRTYGTQVVGSLGIVKAPNYRSCNRWDLLSFSCFFDQATDDRVNTFLHSLYLSQLRLQLGYAVSKQLEIGAVYSTSLRDDKDVVFRFIGFPLSAPAPGIVNMSESVSAYAAGSAFGVQWSALVGYRDDPGTMVYAASVRRSISRQMAFVSNVSYQGDFHSWGAFSGFELSFAPKVFGSGRSMYRSHRRGSARSETVRGQSPSGALVSWVPGGPSPGEQPDTGLGRFSQSDLQSPSDPQDAVSFTELFAGWFGRSVITLLPTDFWRNVNGDGLADRTQSQIQSAAGVKFGFGPRTDGAEGRFNHVPAIP